MPLGAGSNLKQSACLLKFKLLSIQLSQYWPKGYEPNSTLKDFQSIEFYDEKLIIDAGMIKIKA